ncbi:unnamed protein product [Camellia sinensis]
MEGGVYKQGTRWALVRRIRDVNDCLLVKWWRRFGSEDNALWKRLICSIYRVERGDGNRIRFWIDKWLGNVSLKDEFPRLFSLSTDKE